MLEVVTYDWTQLSLNYRTAMSKQRAELQQRIAYLEGRKTELSELSHHVSAALPDSADGSLLAAAKLLTQQRLRQTQLIHKSDSAHMLAPHPQSARWIGAMTRARSWLL